MLGTKEVAEMVLKKRTGAPERAPERMSRKSGGYIISESGDVALAMGGAFVVAMILGVLL